MTRKINKNRIIPSQEMIEDFSKMGDKECSQKWGIDRVTVVKIRKREGIKSFNNQHGTQEHKFENGLEYKWCQNGEHWDVVTNFGRNRTRWDGLRGWCKICERKKDRKYYIDNDGATIAREYRKTESGKHSSTAAIRKHLAKRRKNFILWEREDESRNYALFENRCAYCGKELKITGMEFDHFVPISHGGYTVPENMIPCCTKCNRGTGGKFTQDALSWLIKKFGNERGELIYSEIRQKQSIIRDTTKERVKVALQSLLPV